MKPYPLLYISSGWIILVSLLAFPREIKSILVIIGALGVIAIAYGLHRKWREQLRSLQSRDSASQDSVKEKK